VIADEIRRLIVSGKLSEGDSLGTEPDLVERFGVSRSSLREALRILEAEGLISVVRGTLGGIVVHEPDGRTTATVLQARNVSLADVHEARALIEPSMVRAVASRRSRRAAAAELRRLVALLEADDADAAEAHWRTHMTAVGRVLLGRRAATVIDLTHHH
jgi:DNA-binding FadR family transcriptional regulator